MPCTMCAALYVHVDSTKCVCIIMPQVKVEVEVRVNPNIEVALYYTHLITSGD